MDSNLNTTVNSEFDFATIAKTLARELFIQMSWSIWNAEVLYYVGNASAFVFTEEHSPQRSPVHF
jgi:hypothetical protein